MPTHTPLISDLPLTCTGWKWYKGEHTYTNIYILINSPPIMMQTCNLESSNKASHNSTQLRIWQKGTHINLEVKTVYYICYVGDLGCIHTHMLTHTHAGKGHQVPSCLWGTTSLSHSPWMCSCVQGFSNLDRSQSISFSLPDLPVYRQTANWQMQDMVSVVGRQCVKAWC